MSDVSTVAAICLRPDSELCTGSCTCGEVHAGVSGYEKIDSLPSGQLDTQVHTTSASPCSHWILHMLSKILMNVSFTFVIHNLLTATCTCYVCFCPYVFAYVRLCVCVCVYEFYSSDDCRRHRDTGETEKYTTDTQAH
jgi:hypothetical protein